MKYHLFKKSRIYTGRAYSGATNDGNIAEAETLEEATVMKERMTHNNPVGWDIYDSETKELVG